MQLATDSRICLFCFRRKEELRDFLKLQQWRGFVEGKIKNSLKPGLLRFRLQRKRTRGINLFGSKERSPFSETILSKCFSRPRLSSKNLSLNSYFTKREVQKLLNSSFVIKVPALVHDCFRDRMWIGVVSQSKLTIFYLPDWSSSHFY